MNGMSMTKPSDAIVGEAFKRSMDRENFWSKMGRMTVGGSSNYDDTLDLPARDKAFLKNLRLIAARHVMRKSDSDSDVSKLSPKLLLRAGKKAGEENEAFSNAGNALFGSKGHAAIKPTGKKHFDELERLSNKRHKQASKFNRKARSKMRAAGTLGKSDEGDFEMTAGSGIEKLSPKLIRRARNKAKKKSAESFSDANLNRGAMERSGSGEAAYNYRAHLMERMQGQKAKGRKFKLQEKYFGSKVKKSGAGIEKLSRKLLERIAREADDYQRNRTKRLFFDSGDGKPLLNAGDIPKHNPRRYHARRGKGKETKALYDEMYRRDPKIFRVRDKLKRMDWRGSNKSFMKSDSDDIEKISYQAAMRAFRRSQDKGVRPVGRSPKTVLTMRSDTLDMKIRSRLRRGQHRLKSRGVYEPDIHGMGSSGEGGKAWRSYMDRAFKEGIPTGRGRVRN